MKNKWSVGIWREKEKWMYFEISGTLLFASCLSLVVLAGGIFWHPNFSIVLRSLVVILAVVFPVAILDLFRSRELTVLALNLPWGIPIELVCAREEKTESARVQRRWWYSGQYRRTVQHSSTTIAPTKFTSPPPFLLFFSSVACTSSVSCVCLCVVVLILPLRLPCWSGLEFNWFCVLY